MKSISSKQPQLFTEGNNDMWVFINILMKYGISKDKGGPVFKGCNSVEDCINTFRLALTNETDPRNMGIIVDMDDDKQKRWREIRKALMATRQFIGIDIPEKCPSEPYIVMNNKGFLIGVWLVPSYDSESGELEDFLEPMIPQNDPLYELAKEYTKSSKEDPYQATFPDADRVKAQLHAWLAVQKEPGQPYGNAINNKYLHPQTPAAAAFVQWVRELFDLPAATNTPPQAPTAHDS